MDFLDDETFTIVEPEEQSFPAPPPLAMNHGVNANRGSYYFNHSSTTDGSMSTTTRSSSVYLSDIEAKMSEMYRMLAGLQEDMSHRRGSASGGTSHFSYVEEMEEPANDGMQDADLLDLGDLHISKPEPVPSTVPSNYTVSRKLRHVNIRNLSVRLHQRLGDITVHHIDGKHNVADIMTKEIKDKQHFIDMASVVTSPRVYATAASAA